MDIIKSIFNNKIVSIEKLKNFGFTKKRGIYSYSTLLSESRFTMTVNFSEQGEVSAVVIDPAFNEPYTLHLADGASGSFVGGVKTEYERILTDIAEKCFEPNVFKTELTKSLIKYIQDKYNDELEYLWKKFPENAVVRIKDNQKWYAAFLIVSRRKLGFDSDEKVEIIDLRMSPDDIGKKVDNVKLLPGYHMNKEHWITICLDGTVSAEEISAMIDSSYELARNKAKG